MTVGETLAPSSRVEGRKVARGGSGGRKTINVLIKIKKATNGNIEIYSLNSVINS